MPDEPKAPEPAVCPWCEEPIREIAFRTFGNLGNVVLTCCKLCMKPIPASILPPPEIKKSPIATPGK